MSAPTTPTTTAQRPTPLRRLAAVLALTAVLLVGAMTATAVAAPRTAPAPHPAVDPTVQAVPAPRPAVPVLPLVLGGIVILAVISTPTVPAYLYRHSYSYSYRINRY
jgi:hypothetical protein